jgi:hypothetical protein
MRRRLFLVLAAALCATAAAQSPAPPDLDEAERALVRSSRAAIIAAGFSEAFFDRHFSAYKVSDLPGDRRVVWRFRAHGHETYVNDSVGSYTDAEGRRVNTHSVAATLAGARDIRRAITRREAERIMRSCIGPFAGGSVVFQQFGPQPRAALVFAATSPPPPDSDAPPSPPSPQESERLRRRTPQKRPLMYVGAVELETGRCMKGLGQSGRPRPADDVPR